MPRTTVLTGAASGIGAATARLLRDRGERVIACDLHDAEVIADLATPAGRTALLDGVRAASGGRVDAIVANAGGGPPQTSLALNFFGALATLEGLRPLLAGSAAPRAAAVSSVASLRPPPPGLVEACLSMDEEGASRRGAEVFRQAAPAARGADLPREADGPLALYGAAKLALQAWCRRAAVGPDWAGAGIPLNVVALGFFATPAAAYVLEDPASRSAMAALTPLRGAFPGDPAAAAEILAWCVGPENSVMTGQILFVDGGLETQARMGAAA